MAVAIGETVVSSTFTSDEGSGVDPRMILAGGSSDGVDRCDDGSPPPSVVASAASEAAERESDPPSALPDHEAVTRVVDDKYVLVRLLGCGSMGEVWLAHHRTLGEQVAVKLLTKSWGDEVENAARAAERFQFEAQVAARLSRKTRHVVRVTDHGDDGGRPYLVMEVLEGTTLEAALLARGSMPPQEVSAIVAQIARALKQAHAEGVLHRDLKPSNVFLTRDEDGALLVKLLDFGIAGVTQAHVVDSRFATGRGVVFGTPGYMSPEQATGQGRLDGRCDLWALACIAYEAMTGVLPVPGEEPEELLANVCAGRIVPLREVRPDCTRALDLFFRRAFAPRIRDRFSSASEMAQAFERALVDRDEPQIGTLVSVGSVRVGSMAKHDVAIASAQSSSRRAKRETRTGRRFGLAAACVLLCSLQAPSASPRTGAAAITLAPLTGSPPPSSFDHLTPESLMRSPPGRADDAVHPRAPETPAATVEPARAPSDGSSLAPWPRAPAALRHASTPSAAAASPPAVGSSAGDRAPGAPAPKASSSTPVLQMDKSDVL